MPLGGIEIETAILFADIRGSTALAEQLGPKAYAEALNRSYQAATDILVRCDATIDKLIGDEVMAFFVPAQRLRQGRHCFSALHTPTAARRGCRSLSS
jgi:adenylate cyclase